MSEKINVAEIFGENVFNDTVMKERLPKNVYKNLKLAMKGEKELQLADADVIANEMKDWAIEKGATHYTHWFQPLTGSTAEKHDSLHLTKTVKFLWSSPVRNLLKVSQMLLHSLQAD
jgi:glutamine synthetase